MSATRTGAALAALPLGLALSACATPSRDVLVRGELSRDHRSIEECDSGERYELVLPATLGYSFLARIDDLDTEGVTDLFAEFEGRHLVAPPNATRPSLAVSRVITVRGGRCDDPSVSPASP